MKNLFAAAIVAGVFGVTITSAFAGPLLLGPISAPLTPKVIATVPMSTGTAVQAKMLNSYRQLRAFWVSRAIVR
ncbi:MAG: hypothetical protein K2X81_23235 [Candidatus Obscuribacterales bacterium]|nr:hypothetical protein [Candidatus Obscuribacterales bacterium]